MSTDFQKDELKVEHYDASLAKEKKKKILKRVGIGIGVVTALGVLGYFGLLRQGSFDAGWEIVGGAGAWYESEIVYPED